MDEIQKAKLEEARFWSDHLKQVTAAIASQNKPLLDRLTFIGEERIKSLSGNGQVTPQGVKVALGIVRQRELRCNECNSAVKFRNVEDGKEQYRCDCGKIHREQPEIKNKHDV
jgi:hypothetical protein